MLISHLLFNLQGATGMYCKESLTPFVPLDWEHSHGPLIAFAAVKMTWLGEFYPSAKLGPSAA